ncbi:hypothetical protein LEP1GSC034_0891 [Leptospira interrogans str. 2003000735]|uniref:Uncharacterized protein n=4 Tax=Leptospira interrogans TaxID=173 RepID=A0A829D4V3_LEPIR|nr:hypothetical protein LEP1GSC067_1070 [Leptospira interrogans serovar Lora str. TE 1992]EMJ37320.1 hypothetical protein LEP1GSC079_0220 [Leptospira interrogans str. FPW1039]EMJ68941.1 hypothetical protein LEP1GSC034_0891 [Leptospira interrogans str. 2003000735]EMY03939.1 hypothetical protein LEP1GSC029_3783 [Leptospira interrogans str. 2002000626]EMY26717.1 hypothetical protein LEP1GSC115_4518 [Leptospira interrogans serovar Australis str. 200703203]KLO75838.1 Uncharacterized protein AAY48_3
MNPLVKKMIKRRSEILNSNSNEQDLENALLRERAIFINKIFGGRTLNDRILKKAEDLSQKYESRQDQISFLLGFVEGYKHLKATRAGDDAYVNGRMYGLREFQGEADRREERFFRESSKSPAATPHLKRVK